MGNGFYLKRGWTAASLIFILSWTANTQEIGLMFMDGLPGSYLNPAVSTEGRFFVGLGSRSAELGHSAFSLSQAFDHTQPKKTLNLSKVVDKVSDQNLLKFNEGWRTLEVGYKMGSFIWSAGHGWKLQAAAVYNRDLVRLFTEGNAPFIGEEIDVAPDLLYQNYNETYVGLAYNGAVISGGFRLKLLNGVEGLKTGNSALHLQTSDDIYQLTLRSDFEVYSSRVLTYENIDDYDVEVERFSFKNFWSENSGLGLDLGLKAAFGRWTVMGSALDIGTIQWNRQPFLYYKKGTSTYEGVDVAELIGSDAEYSIEDSLKSILTLEQRDEAFSTRLVGRINLGIVYRINDLYRCGILVMNESALDVNDFAVSSSVERNVFSFLTVGLNHTIRNNTWMNFGGHLTASFGPISVYAITNNVLAAFAPDKIQTFNIRVGGSLTW